VKEPKKEQTILFLTKWYPNKHDVQLGVFVRKHAKASAEYCNVSLIYVFADDEINTTYLLKKNEDHGFLEINSFFKKSNSVFKFLINPIRYLFANLKAIKVVEKEMGKIDLVQVNVLTRPGVIAVLMYCFSRIPYIVVEHWTGYASGKFQSQSFIKRCISTYIVSKAKAVVVVSKSLKDKMLELGLKNKYVVIPNVIENVCLQKKRDSDVIKILTVADLYDLHKNISDVLSVISKIINETDYKIEYHVIGGGPDEFILREKSDKLGLTNRVVFFHGRQTNEFVYEFYKEIDFVIINSRLETFSVVATEAIVNGKPLITTVCGGPEEFITEKQGVLIEKDNVEELKKAILFMLHNYKMYNAEALNEYAMSKFSYHIIGKQFYDLYNDIIKNNNA